MAEAGHTVSLPPGGTIPSDPVVTVKYSSAEVKPEDVSPKSSNEVSYTPKDRNSSQIDQHDTSVHCISETDVSDGVCLQPVSHQNKHTCSGSLTVHREHVLSPHKVLQDHSLLSIQRSHSDSLQIFKEATDSPLYCETGASFCQGRDQDVCAQSFPSLVCKQAMPLQQNNTMTTSTRAGSSGSGSPSQPAKHGFIQICEVIPEATHIANVFWPRSGPHNHFSLGPSAAKNDSPEVAQNWITDKGHTWAITGPNLSQLITLNCP